MSLTPVFSEDTLAAATRMLDVQRRLWRRDLVIVAAAGEIDILSAPLLDDALATALPAATVVDLCKVTFLDAAGIRILETAVERARAEGRQLALAAHTHPVITGLRIAGLDTRVPVYPTLSDAIREVRDAAPANTEHGSPPQASIAI